MARLCGILTFPLIVTRRKAYEYGLELPNLIMHKEIPEWYGNRLMLAVSISYCFNSRKWFNNNGLSK